MLSLIIPAHNEEAVIARGLRAILTGARPGELEVIVACNGCTDRTADIARGFGEPVHVLEIDQASKTAALNAGDEAATGFPRFYVDADVVLDLASIRAMAAVLERGDALLAAPSLRMDLSKTTWPVRAYYRVWTSLPYNQVMVGTGAYGLSRAGRARFDRFPRVIADDGFLRFSFAPTERLCVRGVCSCVEPPRTLRGLIRIKTRARLGQYQLRQLFPRMPVADRKALRHLAHLVVRQPRIWVCIPVYLGINLVTRYRAALQLSRGELHTWERDDSRAAPTCAH